MRNTTARLAPRDIAPIRQRARRESQVVKVMVYSVFGLSRYTAQGEISMNFLVGDTDALIILLHYTQCFQGINVIVNAVNIPLGLSRQFPQADFPQPLQLADQFPAFRRDGAEQRGR